MHSNLGLALMNARRYSEAELELRKANEIFAAIPEPNPSYVRMAQANTGQLLARTGRLDEADSIFARLFEQSVRLPLEAAVIKVRLITLRMAQGQYAVAENLAQEALDFFSKGSPPIAVAAATAALGAAQLEGKREPEALDTLLRAKAQYEKLHLKASPAFADLLVNIARAQLALGRNNDAAAASGQAVEFWKSFDQASPGNGSALLWHARALTADGDTPKAMNALRQASEILAKRGSPGDRALLTQVRLELATRLR
jgi:tetratricopeptide (TPR) repeat protein